jgi:hypothetical protein
MLIFFIYLKILFFVFSGCVEKPDIYDLSLDQKPKSIYRTGCLKSYNLGGFLPNFKDNSSVTEISDFGEGYLAIQLTLYTSNNCELDGSNQYFTMKNYFHLKGVKNDLNQLTQSINLVNSESWTPQGRVMSFASNNSNLASDLSIDENCQKLDSNGFHAILSETCLSQDVFNELKEKRDFFLGAFLAIKYDFKRNALLLLDNIEDNCKNSEDCYILYKK